ncbi:MAG: signal protein PDZ, partial [Gammaproteobacteria bacterium]
MSEEEDARIPAALRPHADDVDYDLAAALGAVVALRARVPEDAFTAGVLGTERAGHGVVVNDAGLIVTIGYL